MADESSSVGELPPVIAVVGGYGEVGRRICENLVHARRDVVVAGRNARKAEEMSAALGCGNAVLDVGDAVTWDALPPGSLVVCCIDQVDTRFVRWCITHGHDYIDITASDGFFRQVEALHADAVTRERAVILSVGLAPGMTNLMVKQCADALEVDGPCHAQIGILLGMGDRHGAAAVDWTLLQLSRVERASAKRLSFPGQPDVLALPLDLADQHVVRRTLRVESAETLVTLQSSSWTRAAAFLAPLLRLGVVRRFVRLLAQRAAFGSADWAIVVELNGELHGQTAVARSTLAGVVEADATAEIAAWVAANLRERRVSGVHHINQLFDCGDIALDHPKLRPEFETIL